jgi:hypothetical protein
MTQFTFNPCYILGQRNSLGWQLHLVETLPLLSKVLEMTPKDVSLKSSLEHCTREELPLILINLKLLPSHLDVVAAKLKGKAFPL